MNIKYVCIVFVIIMVCVMNVLHSNTIIIDLDGSGDYISIQQGIDNSVNGDTVLVYSGTYYENINYNGKNITLASLYLTIQADSFIHKTVIDGNRNGSVVTFESGEDTTAVLCGFTIQNGSGTHDLGNIRGGGIFSKNADLKISNCIIKNNKAEGGAGIHCRYSDIILENTTICHNHALLVGGGLYLRDNSTATFSSEERCNIYLNYAGRGCDIATYQVEGLNVVVDTFTVMNPDSYFTLSEPGDNFMFDILNTKIKSINQDLYVSSEGDNTNSGLTESDPLRNIAYALTIITSDSTHPNIIHVANGMYSASITDEKFPLNCRSYISLYGEDKENVILDGENISNLLYIYDDNNFSVQNFTIENGYSYLGGGVKIQFNSNPSLINVTLSGNTGTMGGAIYCIGGCKPIFENVVVSNNIAQTGGGGFYYQDSSPIFINSRIIKNYAIEPEIGGYGGIICFGNSNFIMLNTELTENFASVDISGFSDLSGTGDDSHSYMINCTVSNNSQTPRCNLLSNGANLTIINSIFRNNSEDEITFSNIQLPDTIAISYTNIKDSINGINTNNNGTIIWGEENIDEDPLFVGGDPFSYELTQYSPCIDAGTPDTTGLHLPATDLAGNPRIKNGRIDIGAYECQDTHGVDIPDTSFIHNLYLFQNTPNPFKKTTTISFISADYERIKDYTLSIYNARGQLVKRYEGNKDNFWVKTEITWDGRDEYGKQVAPGTYLYKLEYNGHAVVRKMLLLR